MKLEFKASFARDLKWVQDKNLLKRIQETIQEIEAAPSVHEIKGLKKLKAGGRYYRIKLGEYRIVSVDPNLGL